MNSLITNIIFRLVLFGLIHSDNCYFLISYIHYLRIDNGNNGIIATYHFNEGNIKKT